MKKFLLFILCSHLALAEEIKLPLPQIDVLENGLKVAWFVSPNIPVIDFSLLVHSGYKNDPPGKSGVAEFVAATLDRGVAGLGAHEFARQVEMLGATRYSTVDEDSFSIGMHGLAIDSEVLLDLLSKMTLKPDFLESEMSREHAQILDRWSHLGDRGENLAAISFRRKVAAGTQYGRGNFLSAQEFKKVTRNDALNFYKTHFTPKNSLLLVVGKVDPPLFRKKIIEMFGKWKGEPPAVKSTQYTDQRLRTSPHEILLIERTGLNQAQVRLGFKAPLVDAPEHYALVVANALLSEFFNSRLNSVIRDRLGLTYAISSSFAYSKNFADFMVSSATKNETTGPLIKKTVDILKDFKQGAISEEEVGLAKEYLVGSYPLGVSTLQGVATRWLMGYLFNLGPDHLNAFVPQIKKVTRSDVVTALKKYFLLDQMTVVVAGEPKPILQSLKDSELGKVRRVAVKDLL